MSILKPAVLYKDEIIKNMQEYFYTDDMLFTTGCLSNWTPNITDDPDEGCYVIVDKDKLIGYFGYRIDYYCSKAYNFGLFSFDRGNPVIGIDVFNEMKDLLNRLHKIEWRMVGGNPVQRSYDRFCDKYHGTKHILKDSIRDKDGNYHDDIIYEVFSEKK